VRDLLHLLGRQSHDASGFYPIISRQHIASHLLRTGCACQRPIECSQWQVPGLASNLQHQAVGKSERRPSAIRRQRTPRQTTVQVLDRPAGRSLGMRVLNVEGPKA
jgi:hypothetical protein